MSIKNPTQKPIFVAPTLKHSELLEHSGRRPKSVFLRVARLLWTSSTSR